jgi:HSP20 family molecular chaperone IbpA
MALTAGGAGGLTGDPFFSDFFYDPFGWGAFVPGTDRGYGGGGGGRRRDRGGAGGGLDVGTGVGFRNIPIDLIELPDKYEVKADMPGQSKDRININVNGDVLRIGVDRTEPEELDEKAVYHRGERPTGYNARSIRMPRNADLDRVKARYQDGVLIIEVPKKQEDRGREIKPE